MVSGRDEKSERRRRCRGKYSRNVRKRLKSRVGIYSGADRFAANGRLAYMLRIVDEPCSNRDRGGGCDNCFRKDKKEDIRGSVTLV